MALGGGTFLTQNKVLPGSYINFVSAAKATADLSERGTGALGLTLDWGPVGEVFRVTAEEFLTDSTSIFGHSYLDESLKGLRDFFLHAQKGIFFRLNQSGETASCDLATARYSGTRGNDITITVTKDGETFFVETYLAGRLMDSQAVASYEELKDNDFVVFDQETDLTAGTKKMAGGTDGTVETADHQTFLDLLESESFHTLGCISDDAGTGTLYATYTEQMREQYGRKFQTVLLTTTANQEGIIHLGTKAKEAAAALVYWVTGKSAGCPIQESNTNALYDGEYTPICNQTQTELEEGIREGLFLFHRVGGEIRVLEDINSLTEFTQDKGQDFSSNQIIRVLDQIGNDIAVLFATGYLGKVQNNNAGRIAFWNDIITYDRQLSALGAIEDVVAEEVKVELGSDKKSVAVTNPITPVCAMSKLYMTVIVQ